MKKFKSVCKEVSRFIDAERDRERNISSKKTHMLNDETIVSSCVQKLAREKILHSILHSMLHSLGLKDMPSASADKDNFYKTNEIKKLFGNSAF